jgi:hypothetical protein
MRASRPPCWAQPVISQRMSGKSVDLRPDSAYRGRRLADLAVRARVRSSREGSRSVRKETRPARPPVLYAA